MTRALLAGIYALRAQVEALALAAEEAMGMTRGEPVEAGSCPQCHSGPDDVTVADTLDGAKLRHCRTCEHEWVPI